MTPLETIAAAIRASDHSGACEWHKVPEPEQNLYLRNARAAVAAHTLMAAERGWQLVPREATEEMEWCRGQTCEPMREMYRAMLAAAPKYEVGE